MLLHVGDEQEVLLRRPGPLLQPGLLTARRPPHALLQPGRLVGLYVRARRLLGQAGRGPLTLGSALPCFSLPSTFPGGESGPVPAKDGDLGWLVVCLYKRGSAPDLDPTFDRALTEE